jgi:hypothetical protein
MSDMTKHASSCEVHFRLNGPCSCAVAEVARLADSRNRWQAAFEDAAKVLTERTGEADALRARVATLEALVAREARTLSWWRCGEDCAHEHCEAGCAGGDGCEADGHDEGADFVPHEDGCPCEIARRLTEGGTAALDAALAKARREGERAGAEAMRERSASDVIGGDPYWGGGDEVRETLVQVRANIRALPLPGDEVTP